MTFKLVRTLLSEKPGARSKIIALAGLSVLLLFFGVDQSRFVGSGELIYQQGEYWRAFTTSLLHADLAHLGNNALFFTGLALLLNHYFGFWIFPLLSFLVGGLINLVVFKIYPPHIQMVGASGVVYFMAAFWLTLYVMIERKLTVTRRLINCVGIALIFLFPEMFDSKVSYLAHGVGFAFGIPLGLVYFLIFQKDIRSREEWVMKEPDPVFEEPLEAEFTQGHES